MEGERFDLERVNAANTALGDLPTMQGRTGDPGGYKTFCPTGYGYGYGMEDKAPLTEMWRIMRKRKWLIISIVLIITSLVSLEMYRSKAIYQASTIIEIGRENSTVVRSGDLIINDESDPQYQVNIKTKMLLLNSRELHEEVVANLKLDQNPRFLQSEGGGSFWKILNSITGRRGNQDEPQEVNALAEDSAGDEPARSPEESARLAPFVEALAESLTIEPLRDTRGLKVSFIHTDSAIAAAVANGVARAFKNLNFQAKTERFTDTASWLDSSTRELKAKVEQAEQALATYTDQHNIFSINDDKNQKTTLTTEKLARLHDQALRAETDRMLKQTLYQEVKAGHIAQLPEAFSDAKLAELQKQLNDLQTQSAQLGVKYGPKNLRVLEVQQQIASVQSQIDATRSNLEQKLKLDYERAVEDEASFNAALRRSKTDAAQENQDTIQYNILKQDLDTARALYTDFLQKTNQAKAQVAEQHNNIRVIERAKVPNRPIGPKRAVMIMLSLLVSLGGSIGLVFFLEYLDSTIKNVDDVNRYVQLPALGVIPAISSGKARKLLPRRDPRRKAISGGKTTSGLEVMRPSQLTALDNHSMAAEAYRALRTSVLLSAAGNPPKTILVTSSQAGEGKTTTCINTALSLAQLGSSVLIIDCDLRRPTTHKVLGVDHALGLSTYLSRDVPIDNLIQRLPMKNVSLLPCGPIPPNPAELISSEKMRNMLAALETKYDHILLDSPPLINVTDPVILSRIVDGVILVVHAGMSARYLVRRARQELASVGAKIFGVVLNNVNLQREGYDGYYYSRYSYEYEQAGEETTA
ncbi:MAG TPA: polysaccharide biosynthesis tyrosine autokinase [Blastocatellia bacterium]|jgi:capsular exopolysaccharide synthesis family protein|nr:polysaccharide biosynthesis tyrosine autokinase [Blastocatellia bacterium]